MMKGFRGTLVMGSIAGLLATVAVAEAVEVRMRCDYRGGTRERTRVSVDAKDLAGGSYHASVDGFISPWFTVTPPADEFGADFDSNGADIRAGATAIPASTGRDGSVTVGVAGPDVSFSLSLPCPGEITRITP
jgi:hypothetical protein